MDDPYHLRRFVTAQDSGGTFDRALDELRHGYKSSHWMWFIFPQIAGLGRSPTARQYAISSVDEARAYLAHPVLGPRLVQCTVVLGEIQGRTAEQVLGSVDAQKLRSSMTLFLRAASDDAVFQAVLDNTSTALLMWQPISDSERGTCRSVLRVDRLGRGLALQTFSLRHDGVFGVAGGFLTGLEDPEPGARRTGQQR